MHTFRYKFLVSGDNWSTCSINYPSLGNAIAEAQKNSAGRPWIVQRAFFSRAHQKEQWVSVITSVSFGPYKVIKQ